MKLINLNQAMAQEPKEDEVASLVPPTIASDKTVPVVEPSQTELPSEDYADDSASKYRGVNALVYEP